MQLIGKVIGEVIYLAYLKVSFVWQMIPSSSSHFNQPKDCDFCFLPFFRNSFLQYLKYIVCNWFSVTGSITQRG